MISKVDSLLALGENKDSHYELKAHPITLEVSKEIQSVIANNSHFSDSSQLKKALTTLEATANIADVLFNGIRSTEEINQIKLYNEVEIIGEEYIEIYNHIPIIAIYLGSELIFANDNYLKALNYNSVSELINDLKNGLAIEKYDVESQLTAMKAVSALKQKKHYKNLRLVTVDGKELFWNSYGEENGIQYRLGIDKKNGEYKQKNDLIFTGYELKTKEVIDEIISQVGKVINPKTHEKLITLSEVISFVDKVWNEGPYIMNAFISHEGKTEIIVNTKYASTIGLSFEEIGAKHQAGTLFQEHYDFTTQKLITAKFAELRKNGHFVAKFATIDASGEKIPNNWFRHIIKTSQSKTSTTGFPDSVGIGTSVMSDEDAFLKQWS